jgi:hypothetical protein
MAALRHLVLAFGFMLVVLKLKTWNYNYNYEYRINTFKCPLVRYMKTVICNTYSYTIDFTSILILYFHSDLELSIQTDLRYSGYPRNISWIFVISSRCVTCPDHLILFNLMIPTFHENPEAEWSVIAQSVYSKRLQLEGWGSISDRNKWFFSTP